MKCLACGHENLDGAKFCNECAAKLELACPQCGKVNPPGIKFCNECALNLSSAPKTTPKPTPFYDEKIAKIQHYLPKELADKILAQRERIEGERKQVTVLFTDMAGYLYVRETRSRGDLRLDGTGL